jgi:hypothetical protein
MSEGNISESSPLIASSKGNDRENLLITNTVEATTFPQPKPNPSNVDDEFVKCADFFDVKKGWMKFWDPQLSFNQIFVRERDGGLFCFDAFRAWAFLWISNSHMQEGLKKYYDNSYNTWIHNQSPALYSTSSNGVTVFFVISGFLNLMVSMSIAKKFKVK